MFGAVSGAGGGDRSILILRILLAIAPLTLLPFSNTPSVTETETLTQNHVVRFREYRPAADHRSYLEESLGLPQKWRWVERRNPAAAFPTDFGVVEIADSHRAAVVDAMGRLAGVKDVYVDKSYSRSLLLDERGAGSGGCGKRPGKRFTPMSFEEGEERGYSLVGNFSVNWKRELLIQRSQVTSLLEADNLWAKGYTGAKVKMAIFDTGIRADHPHFRNIKERTNWTNEDTLNDNLGHGTFVAGVISSKDPECLGFAPDAEIYAFRVFTDAQVSYTSWFLDAFNYAIATNMDVLNLSIGGPDFMDIPFVEKVWELTANNIIMVSAIGNDGPLYGTLNNPADQSDVIGVGGIDYNDHIASFSSRGMSTWEIPHGYGRIKPDVVAYGREIMGSKISTGCKSLSGTSVASPVVAGVVCLLVSVVPESMRKNLLNPASMKQALVEGSTKLSGPNMYEQGAGKLNLSASFEILRNYQPRASIFPCVLDYTDCPYSWPFCRQPLYAGALPVIFNATIINGMGVIGYVEAPPVWQPFDDVGNLLSIHFTYSDVIWPWTGFLALYMQIKEEGAQFSGIIEGNVTVKVLSPPYRGEKSPRSSTCVLHLKLNVVPTPLRWKRILWDQYHNIKYPPGYIPRDSLNVRNDILDWHGDHPHTNFHMMYNMLRDEGYFIEILGSPLTCFDARNYGTLLMVDLEDEYFPEEIEKLRDDVVNGGLGLAVFAEWYNVNSMVKMRFFDDNTRSWWTPVTGGANIPALNDLLAPFGIGFGDKILNGDFSIKGERSHYASGTNIIRFPRNGYVHRFRFQNNSESDLSQNVLQTSVMTNAGTAILGFVEIGRGRVTVYGDSNCLDSSHMVTNCYWLLRKMLDFTNRNIKDPVLFSDSSKNMFPLYEAGSQLPARRTDVNFYAYSSVVGKPLICYRDSRFELWWTKGYPFQPKVWSRKLPQYPKEDLSSNFNNANGRLDNAFHNSTRLFARETRRNRFNSSVDFFGFLNQDELDLPMLITSQWVVPSFLAVTCFVSFISCHMQQKRRRRKTGSASGRLNMVHN